MQAFAKEVDFISQAFDHQTDSVIWVTPVRNPDGGEGDNAIVDFCFLYCNAAAQAISGISDTSMIGKQILRDKLPDPAFAEGIFEQCLQVYKTGKPLQYSYYSKGLEKYLSLQRVRVQDGVLTTIRNKSEEELDAIFNGSLSGVYSAQVLRDADNSVYDLLFIRANKAFYRIFETEPERIIGKSLLFIAGDENQAEFINYANEVMVTGAPVTHVLQYYNPERWFEFSMVKLGEDLLLITVNDITTQRQAISQIEEQKNLLDSILRYSPNGLAITEAIRNDKGEMVDAKAILMNDACEKYNGSPTK